jgi:lipid-A-disaccharide synthase
VVYYISPQIWASRPGRLATIRAIADRVLVIFPFEAAIYERGGVPVEFVGHPLIDLARPSASREVFLRGLGLAPSAPTVAILPGSRGNEVSRILPDLAAAARLIQRDVPAAQFLVARAPHLSDTLFDVVRAADSGTRLALVEGDTDTVLASADLALTASGTATVQAALHDTPMIIVYRMTPLSYQLAKRVVTLDTIGMVNLIAGETVAPELVQGAFTPEAVAREAVSLLTDRDRATRTRASLATVRARLGGPGASRRAALAIMRVASGQVG